MSKVLNRERSCASPIPCVLYNQLYHSYVFKTHMQVYIQQYRNIPVLWHRKKINYNAVKVFKKCVKLKNIENICFRPCVQIETCSLLK